MDSWNRVLEQIEKRINRHSFRTWFQPTKQIEDKGGKLTIRVPNPLFLEWINANYRKVVDDAAAEVKPPVRSVSFVCPNSVKPAIPIPAVPRNCLRFIMYHAPFLHRS